MGWELGVNFDLFLFFFIIFFSCAPSEVGDTKSAVQRL